MGLFSSITVAYGDLTDISSGIQLLWGEEKITFCTSIHNFLKNPKASYPCEIYQSTREQKVSGLDIGKISSLRILLNRMTL